MVPQLYSIHGWAAQHGTEVLAVLFAVHVLAAAAFEIVPYRIAESRVIDACRVPRSAAEAYGGTRWRKLLANVLVHRDPWLRESYFDWICRASREPLRSVELVRSGPQACANEVLEHRECRP